MLDQAVIIRDKTRLEQLIERFNSKAQAKFYIEHAGGDFTSYETEHERFYNAFKTLKNGLLQLLKTKVVFRSFLPTYLFSDNEIVIVFGQDGLVANTAKYVNKQLVIGVNPDSENYDGVLLPFDPLSAIQIVKFVKNGNIRSKQVYLAKATLNDGQELYAFNDFYIGANSHVSSRYKISYNGLSENQSSSGIIVSTKAGATGWLSSIYNMATNVLSHLNKFDSSIEVDSITSDQCDDELVFTVREPFKSVSTQTSIGFGQIMPGEMLTIESKMTDNGVIFSDGIESDFLQFNAGKTVTITIADRVINLVQS